MVRQLRRAYWRWWRWQFRRYGLLVALAIAVLSLALLPQLTKAEIGRLFLPHLSQDLVEPYQLTQLSSQDEVALGQAVDAQLKQEGLRLYQPTASLNDNAVLDYVSQLGQQLTAVCANCATVPYRFQVVDDPGANAFATLGGFVYVQTGLLQTATNEAELAFVLAHEISHLVNRHGVHQLWQSLTADRLRQAQAISLAGRQQAIVDAGIRLRLLSRSLLDEYTADAQGFAYLGQAGYSQSAAVTMLEKMAAAIAAAEPEAGEASFLASRVERLAALAAIAAEPTATGGLDAAAYRANLGELALD